MNGGNDDFDILKELIGEAEAQKIARNLGGVNIYIPKNVITVQVHRTILQEYKAGVTYRVLALKYGYTESYLSTEKS
jgi:Mor family transcriptional regulator